MKSYIFRNDFDGQDLLKILYKHLNSDIDIQSAPENTKFDLAFIEHMLASSDKTIPYSNFSKTNKQTMTMF